MSYFYTKVPAGFSPLSSYQLTDDIILKPAGRTEYKDIPGPGSAIFFDTIFFISESQDVEVHIQKLRKWVLFHAFTFWFSWVCEFFESGLLMEHKQADGIEEIGEKIEANAYARDLDDIGSDIYSSSAPSERISYRALFDQYEALGKKEKSLLETYLFQIRQYRAIYKPYMLFEHSRQYWQIAIYATVLEAIIGHATNCPGSAVQCIECNKKFTHRQGSEKEWRKSVLSNIIKNGETRDQYLQVINAAYDEIRHKTAHPGHLPIPEYLLPKENPEVYGIERSIKEFRTDELALQSLLLAISMAARFLLLHKLYNLDIFPTLPPLQAVRVGNG